MCHYFYPQRHAVGLLKHVFYYYSSFLFFVKTPHLCYTVLMKAKISVVVNF